MKYTMDRSGIGYFMRRSPPMHLLLLRIARERLSLARARAPRSKPGAGGHEPGTLANSGRVDDLGIRPVFKGEPRMTVAVTFYAPYAAIVQKRTRFMDVALGRPAPEPPDLPGGGR